MRHNDPLLIAIKLDHHERSSFFGTHALSIFFCQMTVGSKAFQSVWKLNDGALVISAQHRTLVNGTHSKCILQAVPGIFFQLFMAKLQFAVVLINAEDHHFNVLTHFRVLTWVIETFQPAEVRDMDHTTNASSEFNKHTE